MSKDPALISVIIPILNEIEQVPQLIHNLISQTYRPIEAIFIDGGSTDGTRTLLTNLMRKHSNSSFNIVVLDEKDFPGPKSPAHARNVGITMASGDYLILLDADTSFTSSYSVLKLKRLLDSYDFVRVKVKFQIDTAIEQQISLFYPQYYHCAYRKWLFNNMRFNERLGFGEDRDLWYRVERDLNIKIHTSDEVLLCRHLPHTKTEYFNQAIWYAKSYPRFVENVMAEHENLYFNEIAVTLLGSFLILFPLILFSLSVLKDIRTCKKCSVNFLMINFLRRCIFSSHLLFSSFNKKYLNSYVTCLSHVLLYHRFLNLRKVI